MDDKFKPYSRATTTNPSGNSNFATVDPRSTISTDTPALLQATTIGEAGEGSRSPTNNLNPHPSQLVLSFCVYYWSSIDNKSAPSTCGRTQGGALLRPRLITPYNRF